MRTLAATTLALIALGLAPPAAAQDTGVQNPPADVIVTALSGEPVRTRMVDLAMGQVRFPAALQAPLRRALSDLVASPAAQAALGTALRDQFTQFGFVTPSDDQIARVGATLLPSFALDGAAEGLPRLPVADQRAVLATRLSIAEGLTAERCDAYLNDRAEARGIEMSAIAALPPDRAAEVLGRLMAASLARYQGDLPDGSLPPADEDRARRALGAAIMAAVDAGPDPGAMIAALSPLAYPAPAESCAARLLTLRAALALGPPDGDLAVRLIADYGLDGS